MNDAPLSRPTIWRNLGFWLLTLLLGTVLLPLGATLAWGRQGGSELLLAAGLAAGVSLAALPLLLLLLPWALSSSLVAVRWLRVFTLQSASLGGLTALGYHLAGGDTPGGFGPAAPLVGTVYFGAGLLVALVVYARWLWRLRHRGDGLPDEAAGI